MQKGKGLNLLGSSWLTPLYLNETHTSASLKIMMLFPLCNFNLVCLCNVLSSLLAARLAQSSCKQ